MPTLRVELPARASQAEVEALRDDLAPYGYAHELPSASFNPAAIMLGNSFISDVLQGADVLVNWLRARHQGRKRYCGRCWVKGIAVGWAE